MHKFFTKIPVLRSLIREYEKVLFQRKWRKQNSHNTTVAGNIFPIEIVSVGKMSYGLLNVLSYLPSNERLQIGHYVSIAPNVLFILGGNHQIDTITSFPFYSMIISPNISEAESKGAIIVNDDVWIGTRAMILSGITIGKGAVIAAGSVVTKNVPPYAIFGGNPAHLIKYRFSTEIIDILMSFRLSDLSSEQIRDNIKLIYTKLKTKDDAEFVISSLIRAIDR
jgi:acetyltransferase-like isoleucine patch superfamily enzyme